MGGQVPVRVGSKLRLGIRNGHLEAMQFSSDLTGESKITRQRAKETANRNMWEKQLKVTDKESFHFADLSLPGFSFPKDVNIWGYL